MNEFDTKAADWDKNPMHWERSYAIVKKLTKAVPFSPNMAVLEYGAGTGITSFILRDKVGQITMMDNSAEMIRVMNEKIKASGASNLNAIFFDLENDNWRGRKFDVVLTQMVLHHVTDIKGIIRKFSGMLNPGGYLVIADLYAEDGSFHGPDFTGHKGFDTRKLETMLEESGFINISAGKCYVINKIIDDVTTRQYDVFLLTAKYADHKTSEYRT